jgi:hypothetical protein
MDGEGFASDPRNAPPRPISMNAKESFSNRLKQLRGSIPIKDLAANAGLSATALYKAEGGEDTVQWKTIEAAYGDLCKYPAQYEEILMLWAMTQSERPVALYAAREALTSVLRDEGEMISKENAAVLREMEMMTVPDQRLFVTFAGHFRRSEHTRKMAEVWVDSSEEWIREMGKS